MKRLFDLDTPLMHLLSRIADLVILNVVFLVCCLPIFTVGASVSALYSVELVLVNDEGSNAAKSFFKAFGSNFKKSTVVWIFCLLTYAFLAFDYFLLTASEIGNPTLIGAIIALPGLLLTFILTYLFPMIAKFENSIPNQIKNSAALGVAKLPQTLLMTTLNLAPIVILLSSPYVFLRTSIVWVVIGFSGIAYVNSMFLARIFDKLIQSSNSKAISDNSDNSSLEE